MKLLVTVGAYLFSGLVAATPLNNLVVFGDSLSDNGNLYEVMKHQLPQSPPYYEGRFSNGPVWVEHLVKAYYPQNAGEHLLDYAYGGAGVSEDEEDEVLFTLKREVDTYLLSHDDKAKADDLYVVWIGANNYLAQPENAEETIANVNLGIIHSLEKLVSKGAKHILVLNLPDLSKTPAAHEFEAEDTLGYLSRTHNELFKNNIAQLQAKHTEVQWLFFDLSSLFDKLVTNPEDYGFTNVTKPCSQATSKMNKRATLLHMVSQMKSAKLSNACDGFLFFDLVHPASGAHELIAQAVKEKLDAEGVTFK